jgi:nitrite reductase (NADH) small subunit
MSAWVAVCRVEDIPVLGARRVGRDGAVAVAVFRNSEGKVFALLDRCPHKGGPLSQGIVFGESVACPLHNWTIGLADGCAKAPDVGCTTPFACKVDAGQVFLDADELRTKARAPFPGKGEGWDGGELVATRHAAAHQQPTPTPALPLAGGGR